MFYIIQFILTSRGYRIFIFLYSYGKMNYQINILKKEHITRRMSIFSQHEITTISIESKINGVANQHEKNLPALSELNECVVFVGSNFDEKRHHSYPEIVTNLEKKSKRGRKPKEIPASKKVRKIQGNGKYMNSQTSYYVKSQTIPGKIYKAKVFRNGSVQIPGIRMSDMSDGINALIEIKKVVYKAINYTPTPEDLENKNIRITMRNYRWRFANDNEKILNIDTLLTELVNIANGVPMNNKQTNKLPGVLDIYDIKYNPERFQGLVFRIRSSNDKDNTSIKIFKSGKVNISTKENTDDVEFIKSWIETFINMSNGVLTIDKTVVPKNNRKKENSKKKNKEVYSTVTNSNDITNSNIDTSIIETEMAELDITGRISQE